jgi:hypothetical protein
MKEKRKGPEGYLEREVSTSGHEMRCRRPVSGSLPYRPLMWEGSEVTASRINVARVMKIVLASMICTRSAVQLAC